MTDQLIQVPYSPSAESAILGSLLIDPEAIKELSLTCPDFYLERNRVIFETMQVLRAEGSAVDFTTLGQRLQAGGKLALIGGPAYLMGLVNETYSAMHLKSYVKIVRDLAKRRATIEVAQSLAVAAYDLDGDLEGAISGAMDKLSKSSKLSRGAVHISDVVSEVYDEVVLASENPQDVYGITTGFPDWDKLTHGIQKGGTTKISGEPGVGKSLLAMQILIAAAKAKHPGAMYQLEMRRGNVIRRVLSGETKISTYAMRAGKMTEGDWPVFTQSVEELSQLPVYIEANSQLTTSDIRSDLYRLKAQAGVEIVVIDYEGLLKDNMPGGNEIALSNLRSSRVHDIAVDLDLAIIVLSDMNKEGIAGTKPGMTGVAGGAGTLHDADEIIMMRRDKDNTQKVCLSWEKNREGKAKQFIDLLQQANFPAFVSPAFSKPRY